MCIRDSGRVLAWQGEPGQVPAERLEHLGRGVGVTKVRDDLLTGLPLQVTRARVAVPPLLRGVDVGVSGASERQHGALVQVHAASGGQQRVGLGVRVGTCIRMFTPPTASVNRPKAVNSRPTTWLTGTPAVSYTHLRAHETDSYLVCRL